MTNNFDFDDFDKDNDNPLDDSNDSFDNFFSDDSFEQEFNSAAMPADEFDESLLLEEDPKSGGSGNRPFVILVAVLAAIFVILVAVVFAIVIGGGESCGENCQLATQITIENQTREAEFAASETAAAIAATQAQETLVAVQATETETFVQQETATREALNTAVAATETQQSADATATEVELRAQATQTALASITPSPTSTDTPVPTDEPAAGETDEPTEDASITEGIGGGGTAPSIALVDANGNPLANVTICIFQDDGDGEFDPDPSITGNCSAANLLGTSGTGGSEPAETAEAPVPTQEPTAEPPRLNPILQTATAQAAGAGSGGVEEPATGDGEEGFAPPEPPTPESLDGTGANSVDVAVRRSRVEPQTGQLAQQDGGDTLIDELTTDAQGRLVIPELPAGSYFIKIADQSIGFDVTTEPQVLTVPLAEGETIDIVVPAAAPVAQETEAPSNISPIFQTATAIVAQQTIDAGGGIGGIVPTPTTETDGPVAGPSVTAIATTGLFDGEGGEVTTTDLLILAIMGMVLVGVVVTARRMRTRV